MAADTAACLSLAGWALRKGMHRRNGGARGLIFMDIQTVQLIVIAVVALVLLLQSIAMLVALIVARKAISKVHQQVDEMRTSVLGVVEKAEPVIAGVRDLITHTSPKIESTITDLAEVTSSLRKQTSDVQAAADDLIARFRRQGARVDTMLTKIFDSVDRASGFMTVAVSKPVRQISAILASAKAVVESLRNGSADSHEVHGMVDRGMVDHATMDKDGYL